MDLKEIRDQSKKILADFIDEIGWDGEYYVSGCNCPMAYGKPKFDSAGQYISPDSAELEGLLQASKYDEKTKKILSSHGVILINRNYKQEQADPDLYVTVIHEMLHSCRNLLIFDAIRDKKSENAFTYNNGKFEQNTPSYGFSYADASQDILKGSIDTSRKTIQSYNEKTSEELDDAEFKEGKRDSQMEKQRIVDEALVELMSALSYKLHNDKEKGKQPDIWLAIERAKTTYEGEDIGAICEIILKHHDFELFYYMLDPITYSFGDIHYDFFTEYTKQDSDLLEKLYDSHSPDIDDILGISETNEIGMKDVEKVAKSTTAIQELSHSIQDIKNAQDLDKKTEERE